MDEFEIIDRYFKQPFKLCDAFWQQKNSNEPKITSSIGDDCASIISSNQYEIVLSTDSLIQSVHFFADSDANLIAHQALSSSISDLMAMGAKPLAFLLSLSLPQYDQKWLTNFSKGLTQCAQKYSITLIGGNIAKSNQLNINIQVIGYVKKNQSLKRTNLKKNDDLYLTGSIGAAGLAVMQKNQQKKINQQLLNLLHKPDLPIEFAYQINHLANCAIDISDGLWQDCFHLIKMSKLGLAIDLKILEDQVIHLQLKKYLNCTDSKNKTEQILKSVNQGGDYQLLFSAPQSSQLDLFKKAKKTGIKLTKIGKVITKKSLIINYLDQSMQFSKLTDKLKAYKHF